MASTKAYVQADELNATSGIRHAYFTREDGASSGIYAGRNIGLGSEDDREPVLENRARCARDLGVAADKLATPYQIHSPNVITVTDVWDAGEGPKADALVTNIPGLMMGIATADCGPVLFADDKAGVVGAAHAGWRGATGGVLENTITAMEDLGADRANITAVLGPTIAQPSYEVGPEFVENLLKLGSENAAYFQPNDNEGHAQFDLPRYVTDRLTAINVGTVNRLDIDTYADDQRFYSFRRTTHRGEADYGRQLSAIVLEG